MNLRNIGKNIRQERKKQHLTIAQLAEKAEISDNFMGNIERGTDIPSLDTLIKISNALLIDMNEILKDELLIVKPIEPVDKLDILIKNKLDKMNSKQKQYILEVIKDFEEYNKE